jgi:UDP-N-acetylglucosamine 1-carboxyvinyltransferase
MYSLIIEGGKPLNGIVKAAGAKNAALPLMAASILSDKKIQLSNIPKLSDIKTMCELLINSGVDISENGDDSLTLHAKQISNVKAPYEIVRKMRASAIIMGGLLAREGRAELSLPGGCAIGTRPIDYHLEAFKRMGAEVELESGYIVASANKGLRGANIAFPTVSVGATENVLIAATLAKGTTVIENAATEPEVSDLANMLVKMGAKISGIGTRKLEIEGVTSLKSVKHEVISDRIEAASYLMVAAITKGKITVENIAPELLEATISAMKNMDINIDIDQDNKRITASYNGRLKPLDLVTEAFPGFPTDMQAQITALMCLADGKSHLVETIFENRFMHIPELRRMGANIESSGNRLTIRGIEQFKPAEVMATDLRASFSLILAALNAEGESKLNRVYHLDRGYEKIEEKLNACGAKINRVQE